MRILTNFPSPLAGEGKGRGVAALRRPSLPIPLPRWGEGEYVKIYS